MNDATFTASVQAESHRRDQERTFFAELKNMLEQMGADWIINSIADAEVEIRESLDANDDATTLALDNRMRAECFK